MSLTVRSFLLIEYETNCFARRILQHMKLAVIGLIKKKILPSRFLITFADVDKVSAYLDVL